MSGTINEMYTTNADFKSYVDKYMRKEEIDLTTALSHKMIQNYAGYLIDRGQGETKLSNMWSSAGAPHENMAEI